MKHVIKIVLLMLMYVILLSGCGQKLEALNKNELNDPEEKTVVDNEQIQQEEEETEEVAAEEIEKDEQETEEGNSSNDDKQLDSTKEKDDEESKKIESNTMDKTSESKIEIQVTKASGEFNISADSLNVRSGNGIDYDVLGQLTYASKIKVTGKTSNGWYRFDYNGKDGYVSGSHVTNKEIVVKKEEKKSESKDTSTSNTNSSDSGTDSEKTEDSTKKEEPKKQLPAVAKTNIAENTDQIVTVVGTGGGSVKVEYWKKSGGEWTSSLSTNGFVGPGGITGNKKEGDGKTPAGAFRLGFAFGTSNPGTKMPYRAIKDDSYWISNVNDPDYNTWQNRDSSNSADEHLISYKDSYKYAMVINYNTHNPTKGAGSAIFLHVSNGSPTLGCVSIPESHMVTLMKELKDSAQMIIVNSESDIANY